MAAHRKSDRPRVYLCAGGRNSGPPALPVKIVPWRAGGTVERCDNFVHHGYMTFSHGVDALWRVALQVAALHSAVCESSERGEFGSYVQPNLEGINEASPGSSFLSSKKSIPFWQWLSSGSTDSSYWARHLDVQSYRHDGKRFVVCADEKLTAALSKIIR